MRNSDPKPLTRDQTVAILHTFWVQVVTNRGLVVDTSCWGYMDP